MKKIDEKNFISLYSYKIIFTKSYFTGNIH